jgi:hypothetical protein
VLFVLLITSVVAVTWNQCATAESSEADGAVERVRKQVRMLDDLYKTAIVLVTENYVKEDSDLAAGSAFRKLFDAMKEKGWHEVRLLDATGSPYNEENSPRDGFEKKAIEQILAGKTYFDEVREENGQRFLHAATPIPVVMKKCVMCHDNYADVPAGKAIGALGYTIRIE